MTDSTANRNEKTAGTAKNRFLSLFSEAASPIPRSNMVNEIGFDWI
jgi:hypothetical protein